jgi:hypothetical protein
MRKQTRQHTAVCMLSATMFSLAGTAHADCRSALNTPNWSQIARSVSTLQLCEQIPVGPNQTARFDIVSLDTCSFPNNVVSFTAKAILTCQSGQDSFVQMPSVDSEVTVAATLDMAACRIISSDLKVSGEIGAILSSLEDVQAAARNWAQSNLSRLCAMQR